MFSLKLFAASTGLHLAVLQFCYFFVLMLNITSTYVTYMTLVISWMAGTLAGLFLNRLSANVALLIGMLAYYTITWLVFTDPLRPWLFALSALGVAASGLWAGRFFIVMLPTFPAPDTLFLHENNGFLVGVIGVFVGFSLLGKAFLFYAPAVSLTLLGVQMGWLHARGGHVHLSPWRLRAD